MAYDLKTGAGRPAGLNNGKPGTSQMTQSLMAVRSAGRNVGQGGINAEDFTGAPTKEERDAAKAAATQPAPPVRMAPQPDVPSSVQAERNARMRNTPNQGGRIVVQKDGAVLGDKSTQTMTYGGSEYRAPQQAPQVTQGSDRADWQKPFQTPVAPSPVRPAGPNSFGATSGPASLGNMASLSAAPTVNPSPTMRLFEYSSTVPQLPVAQPQQMPAQAPQAAQSPVPYRSGFPLQQQAATQGNTGATENTPPPAATPATPQPTGYQADASTGIAAAGGLAAAGAQMPKVAQAASYAKRLMPVVARNVAPLVGTAAMGAKMIPGAGAALAIADPVLKYGSDWAAKRIGPKAADFKRPAAPTVKTTAQRLNFTSNAGRMQRGEDRGILSGPGTGGVRKRDTGY